MLDRILANQPRRPIYSRARFTLKRITYLMRLKRVDLASQVKDVVFVVCVACAGDCCVRFCVVDDMCVCMQMQQNQPPSSRDIRACFNAFDTDHNGVVDIQEYIRFLRLLGVDIVPDKYFEALWREADLDDDGDLNYEEFVTLSGALFDLGEVCCFSSITLLCMV